MIKSMLALRFLLAIATAVAALGTPRVRRMEDETIPGKYIVTLKEDADKPAIDSHVKWVTSVHARSISRRDKRGVNRVWKNNFKGTLVNSTNRQSRRSCRVKMYVTTAMSVIGASANHGGRSLL